MEREPSTFAKQQSRKFAKTCQPQKQSATHGSERELCRDHRAAEGRIEEIRSNPPKETNFIMPTSRSFVRAETAKPRIVFDALVRANLQASSLDYYLYA